MNSKSLKILSLGFIMSILLAVSTLPTGDSIPTGITDDDMVANGCTCHTTGPMDPNVAINLSNLPEKYNSSQVYTLTLNISGGPDALAGANQGGFFIQANYGT